MANLDLAILVQTLTLLASTCIEAPTKGTVITFVEGEGIAFGCICYLAKKDFAKYVGLYHYLRNLKIS